MEKWLALRQVVEMDRLFLGLGMAIHVQPTFPSAESRLRTLLFFYLNTVFLAYGI